MLGGAAGVVFGVTESGLLGVVLIVGSGLFLACFACPVVLSTIFRVPVVVITGEGIRFPLMGVHLEWSQISSIRVSPGSVERSRVAKLLIFPTDIQEVTGQVWPWLRSDLRRDLSVYGTPLVVSDKSLDHSLEDIVSAISAEQGES